jgi:hypothetical protein
LLTTKGNLIMTNLTDIDAKLDNMEASEAALLAFVTQMAQDLADARANGDPAHLDAIAARIVDDANRMAAAVPAPTPTP